MIDKHRLYIDEKEKNKKSALDLWKRVPAVRRRLHNIEERLLDIRAYEENFNRILQMDRIRNFLNNIAEKLRKLYEYYFLTDNSLMGIEAKFDEIRKSLDAKKVSLVTKSRTQNASGSSAFNIFARI